MPTILADARAAVTSARRRLVTSAAAEGAAGGALYGAAAGVLLAFVALAAPAVIPLSRPLGLLVLLILPVAAAAAGAVWSAARAPSFVDAALVLDSAAETQEAFVSALSADDAPPAFRELAAQNALRRCPPSGVGRFLPFAWPRRARGAVVGVALLAAVALVAGPTDGSASAATQRSFLPPGHTLVPATADAGHLRTPEDLREVDSRRLRETAEALLSTPGYEEAERALAALAAGDRVTALLELEKALERVSGGSAGGPGASGDGPGGAPAGGGADDTPAPWAAGSWPLRYDRVVDRWLEIERERADVENEEAR